MFLPNGSKDEKGSIVSLRADIYETFRAIAKARGYREISTPVIEYAETFTNEAVGMDLSSMHKWFNRDGGIEVLRPDWTPGIARALAKDHSGQKLWAYHGSVFRDNIPGSEFRQAGVEILHAPGLSGEAECLLVAKKMMDTLGIENYLIELGHSGIFAELVNTFKCPKNEFDKLRLAMHDKRQDEVFRIASHYAERSEAEELANIAGAFGSLDILDYYETRWRENPTLSTIVNQLRHLAELLQAAGVPELAVDLGRVKNLPYYSGAMFRGYAKVSGDLCFSGGRYDRLYKQFGQSMMAVGMAFDVDALAAVASTKTERESIALIADENSLLAAEHARDDFPGCTVVVCEEGEPLNGYDRVFRMIKNGQDWEAEEL